jgi:Tfp pilus assembly protein PilX
MWTSGRSKERGAALIFTLVLAFLVTGIAIGMLLMTGNGTIVSRFHTTEAVMEAAADAGIEQGRDTVNGSPGIVPGAGGFVTLELNAPVRDANNLIIPGFTRSVYAGRSGNISGQYGTFASVVSVIQNPRGAVVVRRGELAQESFAKFARFDNQTTSSIRFASGIQVFGPLHTNEVL